ncbi:hypothetical protein [Nocardioides daphniae]|uniref:Uncharacterized protein n=1 Tax=Nocardioides daphniae TaxID=402297 RepID=A0A4P7UB05_9ACTN|nr:hypothetical protein [Nocardioides daphniae]QCC77293.1 hypothetical protein E2C04_09015 [Nocardioides daphniae]GGD25658.1 hypothetical protein GCM10007231_26260 [Nocardioides daphniae]
MSARSEHDEILRRFPTVESVSRRPGPGRVDHVMRRIGILLLMVVVVVGCLGLLGPRTATASGSGAPGEAALEYDAVTRPGLDSGFTVTLTPDDDTDTAVLVVAHSTLERLGIELYAPEPLAQHSEGDQVVLEFPARGEPGESFDVRFSGRIPTTQAAGRHRWEVAWRTGADTSADDLILDATTWTVP